MIDKLHCAKTLRIITAPPVLAATLAGLLRLFCPELFSKPAQLWILLVTLAILPAAAYPLQRLLPGLRRGGRSAQRTLAFVTTLIGYLGAAVLGRLTCAPAELQMLYDTYGLSVCLLTLFNQGFHIKASGHACSAVAWLIFLIMRIGPAAAVPGLLACAGAAWSSLYIQRHTPRELMMGAVTAIAAFGIIFICYQ